MKTYLTPLGFDTTHIFSLLVRFGIESHDKVIIIRPQKDDDRSIRANEELVELTRKIGDNIIVEVQKVNHLDYLDMVLHCAKIISDVSEKGESGDKLYVNLSGGPREILIALTTASLAFTEKIHLVTSFSDVDRIMQVISLPNITAIPDEKEYNILVDIQLNGPTAFAEISSRMQISESTISRQCSRLAGQQWIIVETRGKNKCATISPSGKIMIQRYTTYVSKYIDDEKIS